MIHDIKLYLALRRTTGFVLSNDECLLLSYARFAAKSGESFIRASTAIKWASKAVSVAQRDTRIKTVCRFARYIRLEDKRHELPPSRYFFCYKTRRLPFIYSNTEITNLIKTALALGPPDTLYPHTFANLIALLSATGLRVSEALKLHLSDITADGLLIHHTKFRKTRLVPLHDTAVLGLERYLVRRRSVSSSNNEVFVTEVGQPLRYSSVYCTFKKLLKRTKLSTPAGVPQPRLHDLRHRFAVNSLLECSNGRKLVSQHMLALSTYLGHANVYSTFWYLEAAPELLRNIAIDCESFLFKGEKSWS